MLSALLPPGSRLEDGTGRGGSFFFFFFLCVSCLSVCEVTGRGGGGCGKLLGTRGRTKLPPRSSLSPW